MACESAKYEGCATSKPDFECRMRLWHSSRSASVVMPLGYLLRNPSKCNLTKSRTQPMQYTTFSLVNNLFLHEYLLGEPAYVIRHLARRVHDASTRRSSSYTCSRWLISFISFFCYNSSILSRTNSIPKTAADTKPPQRSRQVTYIGDFAVSQDCAKLPFYKGRHKTN